MLFFIIELLLLCFYFFFKYHGFTLISSSPKFLFGEIDKGDLNIFFDNFIFFLSVTLILLERLMWFFYIKKNIRLTYTYYWLYLYIWYIIWLIFIYFFYFFIIYFITYYQIHFNFVIMNNEFYSFLSWFDLHKFIENPFLFLFDTTSNSHIEAIKGLSGTWLVKSFDFTEKQYILYDVFYNLNEMYNVNPPLRINNEIIQFFIKEFWNESTLDFIYLVEYYYYQLI